MVEALISVILATGLALSVWFGWGLLANLGELRIRRAARADVEEAGESRTSFDADEAEDLNV